MTAKMQSASSSGRPILLLTHASGHGFGTPLEEMISEDADIFTFLASQLKD
jgi:hypothetical protein